MPDLYRLARPVLWRLPPETAHKIALSVLRAGLGGIATSWRARRPAHPILNQTIWGLRFENPFGIAAGFDKDAHAPGEFLRLGFGSVEVGTVTPRPQVGNARPRVFRLREDEAIINSMGFPSEGLVAVLPRLAFKRKSGILGVNIGRNKDSEDAFSDYAEGVRRAAAVADYLVVNVSSPNTPGLRDLQRRGPLEELLGGLLEVRRSTGFHPPLLVKIAPDLSAAERADIAAVAISTGIDGIVVANTTVSRPPDLKSSSHQEFGGLSGAPLFARSTELLADIYQLTGGRLPLIGVGGVSSAADAYAKIRAGASLVQLHTALIYHGLNLIADLKEGLIKLLAADGFEDIASAIGSAQTVRRMPSAARGGAHPRTGKALSGPIAEAVAN
jgi:dihydroorotate dehydrogenase